jgi:tetratricopeptide (TPR) repeat protein
MNTVTRRRFWFAMLAILISAVLCLGPRLKDLGGLQIPHPKELSGVQSYRAGLEAQKRGEWDVAIGHFNEGLRYLDEVRTEVSARQQNVGRPINLRFAEIEMSRLFDALAELDRLQDEMIKIRFNRGMIYAEIGEYRQAIEDFSAVIDWEPSPKVFKLRANAYRALGLASAAEKDEETGANILSEKTARDQNGTKDVADERK